MQSDGFGVVEMFYLFQSPSSYLFQSFYFQQGYNGVCLPVAVVRKHDNFRNYYRIGLSFGTLLKGSKRKDQFDSQRFLTSGSDFIHQKRFSKNQNLNFSPKIYEIRKKFYETKLFIIKRSTNLLMAIFL